MTTSREPTLWDTHEKVVGNLSIAKSVASQIEVIHEMLDKDVWADQKTRVAPLNEAPCEKRSSNIRFETHQYAQETEVVLEECAKGLAALRDKIRVEQIKDCPMGVQQ